LTVLILSLKSNKPELSGALVTKSKLQPLNTIVTGIVFVASVSPLALDEPAIKYLDVALA
jgi:hypothetical protein